MKQKTILTTLTLIILYGAYAVTGLATEPPTEVNINIYPGNNPNIINTDKKAPIAVMIFGSRELEVSKVDPHSLKLGVHAYWCPSRVETTDQNNKPSCEIRDAGSPNEYYFDSLGPSDGYDDLICQFSSDFAHVREGTQKITLKGMMSIDDRGNKSPLFGNDFGTGQEGVQAIVRCCIVCGEDGKCSGCNSDIDGCINDYIKVCDGDTWCNECTGCEDPAVS